MRDLILSDARSKTSSLNEAMHHTKISLLDKSGDMAGHEKRYGVYVDGKLIARIVCVWSNPVRWQCEDMNGIRISPTVFWKLKPRPQRQVIRQWAIDFFDRRVEDWAVKVTTRSK